MNFNKRLHSAPRKLSYGSVKPWVHKHAFKLAVNIPEDCVTNDVLSTVKQCA